MIIAVDYDGTLYDGKAVNLALIQRLRYEQSIGNVVILWSCREGQRLRDAVKTCRENGLIPNCINCNCPQGIKILGHDSRKIYADVYIDDKAAK